MGNVTPRMKDALERALTNEDRGQRTPTLAWWGGQERSQTVQALKRRGWVSISYVGTQMRFKLTYEGRKKAERIRARKRKT